MDIFWLMVLGHLLGDFVFQSEELIKEKENSQKLKHLIALAKHSGIVTILIFLVLILPIVKTDISNDYHFLFKTVMILFFTHIGIDCFKIKLNKKIKSLVNTDNEISIPGLELLVFLIDQIFHIGIIYIIAIYLAKIDPNNSAYNYTFLSKEIILKLNIGIMVTFGCAPFIGLILNYIYRKEPNYQDIIKGDDVSILEAVKVGKIVGILERGVLIILLMTLGTSGIPSMAFVLAIKSLTRFKSMDDKNFSEYYLLGTLFSYMLVLISYFALFQMTHFEMDTKVEKKGYKIVTVDFELGESLLPLSSRSKLKKITKYGDKIEHIIILTTTDTTGNIKINNKLGMKRKNELFDYLVYLGIESNKLESLYIGDGIFPTPKGTKEPLNRKGYLLIKEEKTLDKKGSN